MWFTGGALMFNFITTAICNPNNEKPSVVLEVNGVETKYFSIDVANNATKMFVIIASCYVVLAIIGLLLIKDIDFNQLAQQVVQPENKEEDSLNQNDEQLENNENKRNEEEEEFKNEDCIKEADNVKRNLVVEDKKYLEGKKGDGSKEIKEKTECINESQNSVIISKPDPEKNSSVKQLIQITLSRKETVFANPLLELTTAQSLKTRQFWQIFVCTILSGTVGIFAVASFKTIGLQYNHSDQFLTVTASVGSIIDGLLRPFWGQGIDVLTYKYIYMIILANQIITCATFPLIASYAPAFLIWICLLYPCVGCHFTMLAPISIRIYGRITGTKIFGFLALSMGAASLLAYFLQAYVVKYTNYDTFFWLLSGLSGIAFTSNLLFTEVIRI
jgi:hypothetical protein